MGAEPPLWAVCVLSRVVRGRPLALSEEQKKKLVTLGIPALMLLAFVLVFVFGRTVLGIETQDDVQVMIESVRGSLWAPVAVFAIFTVVGLTGFPQFMLMAAAVVIFGATWGFIYSWLATAFSAYVGYVVGHYMGNKVIRKYAGERINRISQVLGDNGLMASIVVRVVPTAPFAVVNLVAGASHIRFSHYFFGTLIGVIPKAALVAYVGKNFGDFISGQDPMDLVVIVVVLVVWVGSGVFFKRLADKRKATQFDVEHNGAETSPLNENVAVATENPASETISEGDADGEQTLRKADSTSLPPKS